MMLKLNVDELGKRITNCDAFRTVGKLRSVRGVLTASVVGAVGEQCAIRPKSGGEQFAEIIGFDHGQARLLTYETHNGLEMNSRVICLGRPASVPGGDCLLGRVIDPLGRPLDGRGNIRTHSLLRVFSDAPSPLDRRRITEPLITGQRVLDGLLTLGKGQRVGIFAGSGVGKSTLVGEIAKGASADINVIALIGERGREVLPFLDDCLGEKGLRKSVAVVATAEQTPLMRVRAAQTAVTIASDFRRGGADVLLFLDSMTRVAMSQREIGLAVGEPPTARGYTPSVFRLLSGLLEQLGMAHAGSITGIVTVLVDGDDMDEPIADAVRAIVDGHVVLDRKLAESGHFPPIDVSRSISRVFREVTSAEHRKEATAIRAIRSTYEEVQDLLRVGAYVAGSSPEVDTAIKLMPAVRRFLRQAMDERSTWDETLSAMHQIARAWPY
jgi:flagellum-specific ATP synthase